MGLRLEVEVPEGVGFNLQGKTIELTGPKGKLVRKFDVPGVELGVSGRTISISARSERREFRAASGAIRSHLLNAFKGVTDGFVYKLRIVYSHFPITVKVEGKRVMIHNFLGERTPRVARIAGNASVEVSGDEILVGGIDVEEVGQTALNIERATAVKRRDLRVFQDGCYIVEKV